MASYNATARTISPGLNEANQLVIEHVLTSALAATDTLDVKYDTGLSKDYVPTSVVVLSAPASGVRTAKVVTITSCDTTKGFVKLTVGAGGWASGDTVIVCLSAASSVVPTSNAAPYLTAAGAA